MSTIHHINLAAVDLNLLVVFDALLIECHVTRAGQRIGLSQPATSNALARLRLLFHDELFVRTPKGMEPTPRALTLAQPVRQILWQVQSALLQEPTFVPETSERVFTLGMSDYAEFVLLPKLMRHLDQVAPGIRVRVRSVDRLAARSMIDTDALDLAIGYFPKQSPWQEQQRLFKERYVCVSSQDNPLTQAVLTLETYLSAGHLLVSMAEDMVGRVDKALAQQNLKRQVVLSVPHFLVAPFVLAHTHLLCALAQRVAQAYAEALHLRLQPLPLEVSGFTITMLWHSKNNRDPAHGWLRTTLAQVNAD
ncbi:LysR family transcriptional regulator [Anthocerotibacter panamensis]|uniref:LysR family transcriptional regulator n=1 Tax=Anthocerotibacter panamensis TaxID=2857077 RepID=UPI001C4047D3|nr:LysR family transcriptional regulator [Anthocerotibacter panamensis]